ncbi:glycosyltransferase [Bacteroides fragilis]
MLLDAYSLVRRSGDLRKLVIVGDYKSFKTRDKVVLRRISNNPDIIFTGRVTNEELYTIMRGASMLIQPSLYEGFGIPPLESLFLGTPVVLSNIPVFKELYANLDVCFYDLESTHQLAEYMLNGVEKKSSNFILPVQFDYRYAANVILKIINSYESFTTR